ncbi:MAG: D-alanyl-D-alanine carboxypeptidase/D-alanyl-D-alanine-endopeptidase [Desertimonas sp.]
MTPGVRPARRSSDAAPGWMLVVIALVPVLALGLVWRWASGQEGGGAEPASPDTTAPPPPDPALNTPLLSYRRTPGVLARSVNLTAFQQEVADFATDLNATSCVAVDLDGITVGAANGDVALIPASNQKIITGATALAVLGADYTFTTELRGAAPSGGVIAGDVYLVGGGDPLLTSANYQDDTYPLAAPTVLDGLADALVNAGVTRIDGAVVGDGSRYDDEFFVPSWSDDIRGIEAGPYDALLVNDGRVVGDDQRVGDPNHGAARELIQLLQARGITVAGGPGTGTAPAEVGVLGAVTSAPLSTVVAEMMSASDNNTAEMLVKEMGVVGGDGGTLVAGLAVMDARLVEWGFTGNVLADGSGLSNDNRTTCNTLLGLLKQSGPNEPLGVGLPVAGESGTMTDVFTNMAVTGELRAKTGTLGNAPFDQDPPAVKSLSGYLPVDGGGTISFSLILNGDGPLSDQSIYRPIWNALAEALATYPSGPSPAELAPQ